MMRIVYVDVRTRTWIGCLNFLITRPLISCWESRMDCFLSNNFVLNIIFLLLMIVSSWTRILCISLPSVWSFTLIFPEFTPVSFCQKWLWFLTYELPISWLFQMFVCSSLNRYSCLIISWSRNSILNFGFLAVWDFWLKHCVHSWSIVEFLT